MRSANFWRGILSLALCKAVPSWAAQSFPDAGSLQHGSTMEPSSRLPPLGRSLSAEAADDVAAAAGPKVTVRRFVLEAGIALDAAALQAAVAPYLNRPVSYEDLLAATRAVALAYRQAG